MIINEAKAKEIKEVYSQFYDYKDEASTLSSVANDLMKGLAERNADGEDPKVILKGLKKGYTEWKSTRMGEADSLEIAISILASIGEE